MGDEGRAPCYFACQISNTQEADITPLGSHIVWSLEWE